MKRKLVNAMVMAVLLGIMVTLALRLASREPQVEERPLSSWVDQMRRGNNEERSRAIEVLKRAGPEVAPYLAESLVDRGGIVQWVAARAGKHLPETIKKPIRKIFDPGRRIVDKHLAAQALQLMGTNARTAIPVVGEMLQDPHVLLSVSASRALAAMGPEAVPPLIRALDHGDYNIRAAACDGLGNLGTNSADAIPRLLKIITSEAGPITSSAAFTLTRIGEAAIPALVPLLQDTNWVVRRQAAYSLGAMGSTAAPALDPLIKSEGDKDARVRSAVLDALGRIDPVSRKVSMLALDALNDREPAVRSAALQVLRYRPKAVREQIEAVSRMLEDESPEVRGYATLALTAAPNEAEAYRGKLNELAANPNAILAASARESLRIIDSMQTKP